jgi:hypothetical protein
VIGSGQARARLAEATIFGHQRIEEQSIWLHRAVAEKLRQDSALLAKARERVQGWLADASVHSHYAEAWHRVLALSLEEISQRLVAPDESMRALRQCSPFAGALTARERWAVLRRFREVYKR